MASDRFEVGGHIWVLLFYPDGKRSSSEAGARRAAPALVAPAPAPPASRSAPPPLPAAAAGAPPGLPPPSGQGGRGVGPGEEGGAPRTFQAAGAPAGARGGPARPDGAAGAGPVSVSAALNSAATAVREAHREMARAAEAARHGRPTGGPDGAADPPPPPAAGGRAAEAPVPPRARDGAGASPRQPAPEAGTPQTPLPSVPPVGGTPRRVPRTQFAGGGLAGYDPNPVLDPEAAVLPGAGAAWSQALAAHLGVASQPFGPFGPGAPGFPAGSPNPGAGVPVGYVPMPVPPPLQHAPPVLPMVGSGRPSRDSSSSGEYCALFVALIGEGPSPLGVVSSSEGQMVRAFHHFTIVDQKESRGRHLTKGRKLEQGAVKISCARSDPNARNCHGYRKFIKRSVLENPLNGYLENDTIVIRYKIELVVTQGGALSRSLPVLAPAPEVLEPPASLGRDIIALLDSGTGLDVAFSVDGQVFNAHRLILSARSPMFRAMLGGPLKEGADAVIDIPDIQPPVFAALLHFAYADELPEALAGDNLSVPMAQHLLAAADRFQIERLRSFCEQRLCTSVDVETVATTLALAETNHATELKRVCLDFVADNLQAVMTSEGFSYLIRTCPHLQMEILRACAVASDGAAPGPSSPVDADGQGEARVPGLPGSLQRKPTQSFERRVKPRRSLPGGGGGITPGAGFFLPPPPPPPGTV